MMEPLVLHICCAPDEAYVVRELHTVYTLYCFYSNPNIAPQDEYAKRLDEARAVAQHFGVIFASAPYDPGLWEDAIAGVEHTPEGEQRCDRCFLLRFRQTAQYCRDHSLPVFTSVLSVSPHKKITRLDDAGNQAAAEYQVQYQSFNFKKNDGFKKSIILSKELGLYRQDYCGCRLSLAERNKRYGTTR